MLRQLGQPEPNEPIYMISGETYFLHPTNEWASAIDNRVDTQIRLVAGGQLSALCRRPDPGTFEERQDMLCDRGSWRNSCSSC